MADIEIEVSELAGPYEELISPSTYENPDIEAAQDFDIPIDTSEIEVSELVEGSYVSSSGYAPPDEGTTARDVGTKVWENVFTVIENNFRVGVHADQLPRH